MNKQVPPELKRDKFEWNMLKHCVDDEELLKVKMNDLNQLVDKAAKAEASKEKYLSQALSHLSQDLSQASPAKQRPPPPKTPPDVRKIQKVTEPTAQPILHFETTPERSLRDTNWDTNWTSPPVLQGVLDVAPNLPRNQSLSSIIGAKDMDTGEQTKGKAKKSKKGWSPQKLRKRQRRRHCVATEQANAAARASCHTIER